MIINCLNISELSIDNYQLFRNEVSRERRRKADRFRFMIDAYRSVCAELLLQYSLFEATNQYGEMTFSYNKYGKPTLKNVNDFFFNLSHSGDWVVLRKLELILKKSDLEMKELSRGFLKKRKKSIFILWQVWNGIKDLLKFGL